MKIESEKMPEMSKDEVMSVAKQLGAFDKLIYRLKTLVEHFESGRLFLIGKDCEYKKLVKYGPRMKKLVTAVKEKCYFLKEEKQALCEHDERCKAWMKEKEREYAEKVAMLNPVFKYEELVRIVDICKGMAYVDMMYMNLMRRPMAYAEQEKLKERYDRDAEAWQKREMEALERLIGGHGLKNEGDAKQEGGGNGKK